MTNHVAFIIGSSESGERFIALSLYQGTPKVDLQLMLARAAESGKSQTADEYASLIKPDPMLFCTGYVIFLLSHEVLSWILDFKKEDFFVFHVVHLMNQKRPG